MARRRKSQDYKKDPTTCECRAPKGEAPRDNCVCPRKDNCECPSATEDQWIEYLSGGLKISKKEAMMLQTEMTHTTSGFKLKKKRKDCDKNKFYTLEEALDYFSVHEGLEQDKTGQIKANKDGTCPGCGDMDCPGLWEPHFFDPKPVSPENVVEKNSNELGTGWTSSPGGRYADENSEDKDCTFSKCADPKCPGMGPFGLLPPIPGGPVSAVKVTDPAERGPHKACSCESREDFENDVYCPPDGPVFCECNAVKGSNVSCECASEEEEGSGAGTGADAGAGAGAQKRKTRTKSRKGERAEEVKFAETQGVEKIEETAEKLKVGEWDPDPCAAVGGFKLSMGGKGTASTGLQGICCFNAMEDSSGMSSSSEESTYVVYY